ncbi:MAG: hypothetical protein ACFFAN_19445 [Promethearchaeota archaeon]
MKCKIFTGKEINNLEEKINNWLKENANLQIIHVSQSNQIPTGTYPSHVIITIFYEIEKDLSAEKESYI